MLILSELILCLLSLIYQLINYVELSFQGKNLGCENLTEAQITFNKVSAQLYNNECPAKDS